jgi:ectoine hydroxylase-related dioxygenase (phytanoyl-CoA dioxygenase family)
VPRGHDWRHAVVDHDPLVQRVCRLPAVLAASYGLLSEPFFLSQVEGRAPLRSNQTQILHRDADTPAADYVVVFVYLDDFGPGNGATQIVPGSHGGAAMDGSASPIVTVGHAGDILVMDARLLHGATTNHTGESRRSLLLTFAAMRLYSELESTALLRGVRMTTDEVFFPDSP